MANSRTKPIGRTHHWDDGGRQLYSVYRAVTGPSVSAAELTFFVERFIKSKRLPEDITRLITLETSKKIGNKNLVFSLRARRSGGIPELPLPQSLKIMELVEQVAGAVHKEFGTRKLLRNDTATRKTTPRQLRRQEDHK
jgi:hypothetical protein